MSQQPSVWAMGAASNVIGSAKDFSLDLESGYIVNNTEKYHASTITRIALALDAARKVPEGCVRLPDGRDIEPPYYVSIVPGLLQPWEAYIERAIVIARKDGTG